MSDSTPNPLAVTHALLTRTRNLQAELLAAVTRAADAISESQELVARCRPAWPDPPTYGPRAEDLRRAR